MTYRPFNCWHCGIALSAKEVAAEHKNSVGGTAGTRIRSISRECAECWHADLYRMHVEGLKNAAQTLIAVGDAEIIERILAGQPELRPYVEALQGAK